MDKELKSLIEEAKALNNDKLNTLVDVVIHVQKTALGYGGKVPTNEQQKKVDEICKENMREMINRHKERNKELSLSLGIAAYLNTLSDNMFAKGEDVKGIHDCMKMWQKLHNRYFYNNDTGYDPQQTDSVNWDMMKKVFDKSLTPELAKLDNE